jgi:hypothetical protein
VVALTQALKGKVGVPYMFAKGDEAKFIETMGDTTDLFPGPAMCLTAIKNGANLVVFRVAHYTDIADAATCTILPASCLISDRGGVPTAGASVSAAGPFLFQLPVAGQFTGSEIGPFIFALDTNDKFKIRVRHNSTWGSEQTVTFAAATTTAQVTCDQINAQTSGVNATVSAGKVHVEAGDPNDDVEILAVTHDSYSTLGVQEAANNHTAGTIGLSVSIDGATDQDFEMAPLAGETTTFYLTSAQVAAQMSALTDGTVSGLQGKVTITSATTGEDSTVQVNAASTALAVFGFDSTEHVGASGEAVDAWKLELTGPGAYGNTSAVYFYDSPRNPGERMDYRRITPGEKEVYFPNLSRNPDDAFFWKNYINIHDEGVVISDSEAPNAAPYDWPALNSQGITMDGGSDGTTVLTDADWIGHSVSKTGFYAIDKCRIPIIHFFAFGTESNVVHEYAKIWAESRIAKFYHGAVPAGMTPDEAVDYVEGNPPDYSHAAFNSPSLSLIIKEPAVYDSRNNGLVAINGLPFLAAAITRTEEANGPGISPFGIKRGQCPGVLDIEDNVDEDTAGWDLLSLHQINAVVMLKGSDRNRGNEGVYLWGGYTMQQNPSKMQDWAVVWLMKAYELRTYPILQRYIHDPNRPSIWGELKREMAPMFREDLRKEKFAGIFMEFDDGSYFADGELKGAVLNTPDSMDMGEYICRILIKPFSQIGWPIAQFGTMRTGDPWATYATSATLPNFIRL